MTPHPSRRLGWLLLSVWALLGVVLEGLHAFKVPFFFDDAMAALLLRLAHAHGVGLALILLAHAATAPDLYGRGLRLAALLMPSGFLLATIAHPEGDPNAAILLVPVGALCLLADLLRISWRLCVRS